MAIVQNINPASLFSRSLFNFDEIAGWSNFKLSGTVRFSTSDSFGYVDYLASSYPRLNLQLYTNSADLNFGEVGWLASELATIQKSFGTIGNYVNINFEWAGDFDWTPYSTRANPGDVGWAAVSDINVSVIYRPDVRWSGLSGGGVDLLGYAGSVGDVFINIAWFDPGDILVFDEFTKPNQVLMHEILHSLGLSHPFKHSNNVNVVTSDFSALVNAGFQKLGFKINSADDLNKEYFTIMSYDDQSSLDETTQSPRHAYTPMILDVLALQEVYGEGPGTHGVGNDTIVSGTVGYRTYFDRGGVDTIDLRLYAAGGYIDLGQSIGGSKYQVGLVMAKDEAFGMWTGVSPPQHLRWLYGNIENVVGSIGADFVLDSDSNNLLIGLEGDDVFVQLRKGNDFIDGGDGEDTVAYRYKRSDYSFSVGESGLLSIRSDNLDDQGVDTLISVEFIDFIDQQAVSVTDIIRESSLPTYTILASAPSSDEGASATFTVSTTRVATGTFLTYTLSGISVSDISGSLSGTTTVGPDGLATISVVLVADQTTEGDETLTVSVQGQTAFTLIRDTSKTLDNVPPVVHVSSSKSSLRAGEVAVITFTLSEASTDFVVEDLTVSGGTLSNFTGAGTSYSVTFAMTGKSAGVVSVTSGKFSDVAGNPNADGLEVDNAFYFSLLNSIPAGVLSISGTVMQGQVLTAANTIADVDGIPASGAGAITYQWKANGTAISGATANTYTLSQAEVGKTITVVASYTDLQGTVESVTSVTTEAVSNINDAPVGSAQLLVQDPSATTRPLQASDITNAATQRFNSSNGHIYEYVDTSSSFTWSSAKTAAEGRTIAGVSGYLVTITGASEQSFVLGNNINGWGRWIGASDATGEGQWKWMTGPEAGTSLSGYSNWESGEPNGLSTINSVDEDYGHFWASSGRWNDAPHAGIVPGTNSNGELRGYVVEYSGLVQAVQGSAVLASTQSHFTEGQVLYAGVDLIGDADGLGPYNYGWQRGVDANGNGSIDAVEWEAIVGAMGSNYTLGDADVGKQVRLVASYLDGEGATETVYSASSLTVAGINDAPTGSVTISGTATQGQVLTAANTIADADGIPTSGLGAISYQWKANGTAISGATANTYTLTQAEVGKTITVVASYADLQGTVESVTSVATAAVANINDVPTGTNKTIVTAEDTAYTFSVSDFGFLDLDPGDSLGAVRIDTLPATFAGVLKLGATAVSAGQVIDAAQIPSLKFEPAANTNGAAIGSFIFSVRDATLFDPSPNMITIDVTHSDTLSIAGHVYHWKNHALLDNVQLTSRSMVLQTPQQALYDLRGLRYIDSGTVKAELWMNPSAVVDSITLRSGISGGATIEFTPNAGALSGWSLESNDTVVDGKNGMLLAGFTLAAEERLSGEVKLGDFVFDVKNLSDGPAIEFVWGEAGVQTLAPYALNLPWGAASSDTRGAFKVSGLDQGSHWLQAKRALTEGETSSVISAADALAALKLAVGLNPNFDPDDSGPLAALPVSPYQYLAADVNADGKITSADALAILKMAVGRSDAPSREWLFVNEAHDFWNEALNGGKGGFNTSRTAITMDGLLPQTMFPGDGETINLVALLKGDVNGNWAAPTDTPFLPDSYFHGLAAANPLTINVAQFGVAAAPLP